MLLESSLIVLYSLPSLLQMTSMLPSGRLYLVCERDSSDTTLLNVTRLSWSLPQFNVAKEQTFEKLQKRDNLVTLLLSHWQLRRHDAATQLHKSWRPRIDPLLGCGTSLSLRSRCGRSKNITSQFEMTHPLLNLYFDIYFQYLNYSCTG